MEQVALLLCGSFRGLFTRAGDNGTWVGFELHVIRVLADAANVSSFICADSLAANEPPPGPELISRLRVVHQNYANVPSQLDRLGMCYSAALSWGRQHKIAFSRFIRARPDQTWHAQMPPLGDLPAHAVSVRARTLASESANVTADMMAWQGCGWDR
eukprot:2940290-Prymnesium_polylepis.1